MQKFKRKYLKLMIQISSLLISATGLATDLNPEEGLKHLSQNIDTSLKNREEYNKTIVQVSQNLSTLETTSVELGNQKKKLLSEMIINKKTLNLHTKKLQEIEKFQNEEEKKKIDEFNKITQLEKLLIQLKELQKTRQDRINQLSMDKTIIEKSQKEGESLQLTLLNDTKVIDKRVDTLKNEMVPWKAKRKSYEKEALRWNNEVDRHQKMQTEVKLLLDETT